MDEVGSEHSEKRFHFIERVVNLGKGFFELSDGVLFLNVVKRVFDVEDLNADCVQQLFSLIIQHVLFLFGYIEALLSQHRIYISIPKEKNKQISVILISNIVSIIYHNDKRLK